MICLQSGYQIQNMIKVSKSLRENEHSLHLCIMYFSGTAVESFCSQQDGERLFYPLIPGCFNPQDPEVVMTCEDEHDHCLITCELSMILLYY